MKDDKELSNLSVSNPENNYSGDGPGMDGIKGKAYPSPLGKLPMMRSPTQSYELTRLKRANKFLEWQNHRISVLFEKDPVKAL